jgi:hypothetical protein
MKNAEKEETKFFTKKFLKRTIYLAFNPMHFKNLAMQLFIWQP